MSFATDSNNNVYLGVAEFTGSNISANIFGGYGAGLGISSDFQSNVVLGPIAMASGQFGYSNVVLGNAAGRGSSNVSGNLLIGVGAGYEGSNLTENVVIGHSAGMYQTNAVRNVFIGYGIGFGTDTTTQTSNTSNVVIGDASFQRSTECTSNTVLGLTSMNDSSNSSNNVLLGHANGPLTNTNSTFILGNSNMIQSRGTSNILIGHNVTSNQTTLSSVIAIGHNLNVSGLSNKMILGQGSNTYLYADGDARTLFFGAKTGAIQVQNDTVVSNTISSYTFLFNGAVFNPYITTVSLTTSGQLLPERPYIYIDPTSAVTHCQLTTSVSDTLQSNTYNMDMVIVNNMAVPITVSGSFFETNGSVLDPTTAISISAGALRSLKKMFFYNPNAAIVSNRYYVGYLQ